MFRPGLIIGFFGGLGSGKTLSMTAFAYQASQALNLPVLANYDCRDFARIENLHQLFNARSVVLAIDEIHAALIDARSFKSNRSILVTHWIDLIRKDDCMLLYTAQSFRRVDIRLRDLTNYLMFCNFDRDRARVKVEVFEQSYSGAVVRQVGFVSIDARYYFGLYDTRDKRVVLSDSRGGKAVEPLRAEFA